VSLDGVEPQMECQGYDLTRDCCEPQLTDDGWDLLPDVSDAVVYNNSTSSIPEDECEWLDVVNGIVYVCVIVLGENANGEVLELPLLKDASIATAKEAACGAAQRAGLLGVPQLVSQDLTLHLGDCELDDSKATLSSLGIEDNASLHLSLDRDRMETRLREEYVAGLQGDLVGAVHAGDRVAVRALLDAHVSPDQIGSRHVKGLASTSAMQLAAALDDLEVLQQLIDAGGDVNLVSSNGFCPIHAAAEGNCTESLKLLLANGAEVNKASQSARTGNLRRDGATALYVASMNNSTEALQVLLDHGGDVNQALANGATPLFVANYTKSTEAVALLEARGAVSRVPLKGLRIATAVVVGIVSFPVIFVVGMKSRGGAVAPLGKLAAYGIVKILND